MANTTTRFFARIFCNDEECKGNSTIESLERAESTELFSVKWGIKRDVNRGTGMASGQVEQQGLVISGFIQENIARLYKATSNNETVKINVKGYCPDNANGLEVCFIEINGENGRIQELVIDSTDQGNEAGGDRDDRFVARMFFEAWRSSARARLRNTSTIGCKQAHDHCWGWV